MRRPAATLVVVATGPIFERYAAQLMRGAKQHWMPRGDIVQVEGHTGWPLASAGRYRVILENAEDIRGDHIFLLDADSLMLGPVGEEILSGGVTVTTHPGFPEGTPVDLCPYERNPGSAAYVPLGAGRQYHPGAFVGGERGAFLAMAETIAANVDADHAAGIYPVWYEESHLNRYLLDNPPARVLDRRYCWWEHWGITEEALIVHLDKTPDEFEESRRP